MTRAGHVLGPKYLSSDKSSLWPTNLSASDQTASKIRDWQSVTQPISASRSKSVDRGLVLVLFPVCFSQILYITYQCLTTLCQNRYSLSTGTCCTNTCCTTPYGPVQFP